MKEKTASLLVIRFTPNKKIVVLYFFTNEMKPFSFSGWRSKCEKSKTRANTHAFGSLVRDGAPAPGPRTVLLVLVRARMVSQTVPVWQFSDLTNRRANKSCHWFVSRRNYIKYSCIYTYIQSQYACWPLVNVSHGVCFGTNGPKERVLESQMRWKNLCLVGESRGGGNKIENTEHQ